MTDQGAGKTEGKKTEVVPERGSPAVVTGTKPAEAVKKDVAAGLEKSKALQEAAPLGAAPEVTKENLLKQGVTPGANTASGHAAAGSPAGEETAGEGEQIEGNSKAQTSPALMTPSGTIPHGFVSSPGGPVPAEAAGGAAALAEYGRKLAEEQQRRVPRKHLELSEEQVRGLDKQELLAVAHDRGYSLGAGGGRQALASAFLREQAKDDTRKEEASASQPTVTPTATSEDKISQVPPAKE